MNRIVNAIIFCVFIFPTRTPAQEYTIEVIPVNSTYHHVTARAINNNGVVVGTADASPWYGYSRGFVYEDGMTDFIYLSYCDRNPVLSINDNNNYIGQGFLPNNVLKGFLNSQLLPPPFVETNFYISDINNSDHICGSAWDGTTQRLIIYEGTNVIHISSIGFDNGADANALNDSGYVTGTRWEDAEGYPYIYNYLTSQIIYLPNIGTGTNYPYTEAYDINNSNAIVGYYNSDDLWGGFLWQNNNYTLFPYGEANAVNDSGVVVGESDYFPTTPGGNYAFIYDPINGLRDLNNFIDVETGWELLAATDINDFGQITGLGRLNGDIKSFILTPNKIMVTNPSAGELFIAGEVDTIRWIGGGNIDSVKITVVLNWNTPLQSEIVLVESIPGNAESFIWTIPDSLLSYQTKIIIENVSNSNENSASDKFRIKPYVLTIVNYDSTYYAYDKNLDQWGFSNSSGDMWPQAWWQQFSYIGTDPFTGSQYSQWQGNGAFKSTVSSKFSDWVSWVNTFSVNACYFSTFFGIYRAAAVIAWKSTVENWNGSCFGIAGANALAFAYTAQFQTKYPNFPAFLFPITVVSDTAVKRVTNELFTHQFGNPSKTNDGINLNIKTPNQTIAELKQLLKEDNCKARSITLFNNSGKGAHTILAYELKQDTVLNNIQYIIVYDNSYPLSNNPITVNTLGNGGNGVWSTPDWSGWGGSFNLYLELEADTYLNNAIFPKNSYHTFSFIKGFDELEINNPTQSSIQIINNQGNVSGFYNDMIFSEIPGTIPRSIKNGSETPPYGYSLLTDDYSVVLSDFIEDIVETFFFTGNKSFVYERNGATKNQTDRLFFDGGVSATNPDAELKTVKLLNLITETTQEKLTVVRSIELAQNDSIKIENPDSNTVKIISFGTAKDYDIEINYLTETGVGRFGDFNIPLDANTSHTLVPDWSNLTNTELTILVDIGNDGTIDDTLSLINQVTGIGENQGSLLTPNNYNLAQNYPNPFNSSTKISWQSPVGSHHTLKIYDILGNEVATLVDEFREAGRYEIEFDASPLASGIYLYKLQAGSFVETKKMVLMK